MASSSAGPSMSTLSAPPFIPSATPSPLMQQHARTTRKPVRSSPLAGPVLSRSPSQSRMQKESGESTSSELNETERMVALNVHGAFDSRDALKPTFLAPPRPAHVRGSHSRSLQEISRLRPRPVSMYSAPVMGKSTVRNHRRSFVGLDAERARDAEENALGQRGRSLFLLGEAAGQEDQAQEESEEDWGPGHVGVDAEYNSDSNSFSMKLRSSASRTDMKPSSTQARPKSILLYPSSSPLPQSIYSYSPSPSPSQSSSPSPPVSPNSTSTSLSVYSASRRSSASFLSLPPTSPTGDAVWLTQNTYSETPKFTRLGLGAPGVVMPVSAKAKTHSKPSKTPSPSTPAPTATSNAVSEPQAPVPAASAPLSRRHSFIATLSASLGHQRSFSSSNAMSQIAEHGQQQAGHTSRISSSATHASGNDGNIKSPHDAPHVIVGANEAKPSAASSSSPHTSVIAAPVQARSGTAPPKSTESTPSLSLASSNSQSSSENSLPTCSSLPPSPTPSLTRSGSASSSASSLPIHTPPPEAEGFPTPSLSLLKEETTQVEEVSPRLSSKALAITITDVDVARALENAQRTEALNNNLGSSRRRSRLGLGLGRGLERVKSWTTVPSLAKNVDTIAHNIDASVNASASASASTSTPAAATLMHSASPKAANADDTTGVLAMSDSDSIVAATPPLTAASCASATVAGTGLQPISSTNAPPPPVPTGEVPSSSSSSGSGCSVAEDSKRSKKSMRPFSQALDEEEESSEEEEEALDNSKPDSARCGDGKPNVETGEPRQAETSDRVQQKDGPDSCHVRTQTWSNHNLLRLASPPEHGKEKSTHIPRSQSETAILALPSKAILAEDAKKFKKADTAKSEKGHGRRSSIRRMWDALVHRDSSKRNGLS
ncbi:hypothetical protein D9619_009535 [Psilocybe cf. subviscida]|uniref:Uncharacterized protein n=1 Tax=Psilocybe cf. subviscida TaxID=2480587 RepID=A0A8H5BNR1_9AGAR|nr:hypothetical protein D9619_009535 [Psilocybe cf. subviscida]